MIEHEVLVIGNNLSGLICAALLAKKGVNVAIAGKRKSEYLELQNLAFGNPKRIEDLADVLNVSITTEKIKNFFVYRDHAFFKLPINNLELFSYRYFPMRQRLDAFYTRRKAFAYAPEQVKILTAEDLFTLLDADPEIKRYFLALGWIANGTYWEGIDAITYLATLMKMFKNSGYIFRISPDLDTLLLACEKIFLEGGGVIYDMDCTRVSMEGNRAIAAFFNEKTIEAKHFILALEPHTLYSVLGVCENYPVIAELNGKKIRCLDINTTLKEKVSTLSPVIFEDTAVYGIIKQKNSGHSAGRVQAYWRYFVGNAKEPEDTLLEKYTKKFRVLMAKTYPNFWSNVEHVEYHLIEKSLPYYKKIPQTIGENVFIAAPGVYGYTMCDMINASIDAFLLCYKYIEKYASGGYK